MQSFPGWSSPSTRPSIASLSGSTRKTGRRFPGRSRARSASSLLRGPAGRAVTSTAIEAEAARPGQGVRGGREGHAVQGGGAPRGKGFPPHLVRGRLQDRGSASGRNTRAVGGRARAGLGAVRGDPRARLPVWPVHPRPLWPPDGKLGQGAAPPFGRNRFTGGGLDDGQAGHGHPGGVLSLRALHLGKGARKGGVPGADALRVGAGHRPPRRSFHAGAGADQGEDPRRRRSRCSCGRA